MISDTIEVINIEVFFMHRKLTVSAFDTLPTTYIPI